VLLRPWHPLPFPPRGPAFLQSQTPESPILEMKTLITAQWVPSPGETVWVPTSQTREESSVTHHAHGGRCHRSASSLLYLPLGTGICPHGSCSPSR
jgi:hypothetical protein